MVNVSAADRLLGQTDAACQTGLREQFAVGRGVGPPLRVPSGQVRQLHAQHCGLQRVEPEVAADLAMIVLGLGAVVAKTSKPRRQCLVVRGDESRVAVCAEILAGKKRETADRAE